MKRTGILLAFLLLAETVFAQTTLKEGVQMIKDRYGVTFIYDPAINLDRPYAGEKLEGKSLQADLRRLFAGTDISASAKKRQVVLKKKQRQLRREDTSLSEVQLLDSALLVDWRKPVLSHPGAGALGISRTTLDEFPVVFGEKDALKMLQLLPGVQAANEGFSGLSVRGGYADENLILLDGVPVWQGEHAFGLFSAFPAEAISDATIYKGNYPARFGGRLSSVVDIQSAPGNSDSLRWGYTISLLADKIHADGPLGKRLSYSVSGRFVHTVLAEPVLALLDNKLNYWFYDVNARLDWKAGSEDLLYLTLYNGTDWYREKNTAKSYQHTYDDNYAAYDIWTDDIGYESLEWGTGLAALHWNHAENGRSALSWSRYNMVLANNSQLLTNDSDIRVSKQENRSETEAHDDELRLSTDWNLGLFSFGGWASLHGFHPGGSFRESSLYTDGKKVYWWRKNYSAPESMTAAEAGLYAGAAVPFGHGFTASPGVRLSVYGSRDKVYVYPEPRFDVQWQGAGWTINAGYSRMTQGYHRMQSGFTILPIDIWRPSGADVPPMVGDQFSLSGCFAGLEGWEISAELYYKKVHGVTEYRNTFPSISADYYDWSEMVVSGDGTARGAEFLIRKTSGPLTGWLAYTLSKADRVFPDINGGAPFPATVDRRHRINFLASYKMGQRLDMTLSWTFASGAPATVPERYSTMGFYSSSMNNFRLPPVHRADFNINLHSPCRKGTRTWTLGLYNLYGAQNPDTVLPVSASANSYDTCYHPELPEGTPLLERWTILTFIPTISFSREF